MRASLLFFLLAGCLFTSCVPWSVVPIEDDSRQSQVLDPAAYVDSIWESTLLPTVAESAVELSSVLGRAPDAAGQPVLVQSRGVVLSLDTSSRSGKLLLDLDPYDGEADAALLVGPVILGTTLRDAAGFIEFTDFANQIQYADVANELNERVITDVVGPLDLAALPGKTVAFSGACTVAADTPPEIVPVEVTVE
jgi:predicted lipoprotein